jgi:hypothetical protein
MQMGFFDGPCWLVVYFWTGHPWVGVDRCLMLSQQL